MRNKGKKNLALSAVTAYCLLSFVLMRNDYFATGDEDSTTQHFVHLSLTAFLVLVVTLRNGRSIEGFIQRLSSKPATQRFAPFLVAAFVAFTMLFHPRNKGTLYGFSQGMMESTRALVENFFLIGATAGAAGLLFLNLRRTCESLYHIGDRFLVRSPRRFFLAGVVLVVFLETNAISWFQFRHVPVCADEVNYIFQAKIFASGRLYAQTPEYPEFFQYVKFVMSGDKWYSVVAPGFPLLLAAGVLAGATWIVNPALAAASVLLIFHAAKRMFDERLARFAAALMVVSPFFLMLSSVHMSHTATAFFFLLFLYLYLKAMDTERAGIFVLAGLALGGMILTRPLTGFAVLIPWAIFSLWLFFTGRIRFRGAWALVIGVLVPAGLLLAYNTVTNGDPFTFGYTALYGKDFRLGFVKPPAEVVFTAKQHTPVRGLTNLNNGLFYLNKYLLGWPIPPLLFAMIPFALPSKDKWDYLMLASFASVPAAYFFFFHQDFLMGPRYYFSTIPPAVILTVRGFQSLPELWRRLSGREAEQPHIRSFAGVLVLLCLVYNGCQFFPGTLRYYSPDSYVHRGVPAPIWKHIESRDISNALIFIDEFPRTLAYGAGLWRNDPDLKGDLIFARDLGSSNEALMRLYPGRNYYRYAPLFDSFQILSAPEYNAED